MSTTRQSLVTLGVLATLAVVATGVAPALERPYVVVVNEANPGESLTTTELAAIYLGKLSRWPDGVRIMPVDLPGDGALYRAFVEQVLGRSVKDQRDYWVRQVFAGKGAPPPTKSTDADVITYVKKNPGAIGYVKAGTDVSAVKVLPLRD